MRSRFYGVETPDRDYGDFRGASMSRKRGQDRYHKYIKFRGMDLGQLSNPQFDEFWEVPFYRPSWPLEVGDDSYADIISRISKKQFFRSARSIRRCSHEGRCPLKNWKRSKQKVEFRRGSRYAREMAQSYSKTGYALRPYKWRGDVDSVKDTDSFVESEHSCGECCRLRMMWGDGQMATLMEDSVPYQLVPDDENDDSASVVTAHTDDWVDIGFMAALDDYDFMTDGTSEWSEVEGEDIPSP